jgi:hypothetical protein
MVYFQTKNPNLGKFWTALDWKILTCSMAIWNILRTLGIFYDQLVHFVLIWSIFSRFGIMYQELSGNPGHENGCLLKCSAIRGGEKRLRRKSGGQGDQIGLVYACWVIAFFGHIFG